ncbi:hypothetical protein B0H14DRAFT_2588109 [Mycena olivaceomarginata]|nr:hypothetical protein B0H14DRAFT_2588109 [Mycena olivaceomarginata]
MASTIAACRNASTSKKPSIYKNVVETVQRENSGSLATYDFGETFHRKFDVSNTFGKYYLGKGPDSDSQPRLFSANIVAEVGSETEGTWLSPCNKKLLARKLPLRDTSQQQRMIIAARYPTGAPPEHQVLFRDFLGTADAARGADIADEEKGKDVCLQIFGTITEWLSRIPKANDPVEKPPPPTRQRNIKSTVAAPATPDVSMDGTDGPLFPDVDERDQYPTKARFSLPYLTYHIYVEFLSITDKGYGPTWTPPSLSMPAPITPKRTRCEPDAAVEDAFNNLKSVSPTKKTRRN